MRLIWLAALCLPGTAIPARAEPSIFGRWRTDNGSAIVRVAPCGTRLCGAVERVLDAKAPANDINNPNPALRRHLLVGTLVLSGFTRAKGRWEGGTAYDPKAGRSYRSTLELLPGGGGLKVTGCLFILCRSQVWTRVE